jgi:hypothetical protein
MLYFSSITLVLKQYSVDNDACSEKSRTEHRGSSGAGLIFG